MSRHRQPKSLVDISLSQICRDLDITCRRLHILSQDSSATQVLNYTKENIRPYYKSALTIPLRQQIIEHTSRLFNDPSCDGSALISGPEPLYLLAILLDSKIKKVKVNICCYYGCSHQTALLKLLATDGVGLESLELARSALLRLDCKLFRLALLNMRNLKNLTLKNIASDAILQVIGKACPKLVTLDVSGSRQVTDAGLKELLLNVEIRDKIPNPTSTQEFTSWSKLKRFMSKFKIRGPKSEKKEKQVLLEFCKSRNHLCDTMKVINVANTGVTSAGVLLALMHVPKLESLAEYNHMSRVVELMSRIVIDFKVPFNLTQAKSCRTTQSKLDLLAQACPRLQKLHILEPHHPPDVLRLFSHVKSLTVHGIPSKKEWIDGFYEYLRASGEKLCELNLGTVHSEVPIEMDIRKVFKNCPNLQKFTCEGFNVTWSLGSDPQALTSLKNLHIGRVTSSSCLTKVLSLTPELRSLHIHSCYDMTNEQLEKLQSDPTRISNNNNRSLSNNNANNNSRFSLNSRQVSCQPPRS